MDAKIVSTSLKHGGLQYGLASCDLPSLKAVKCMSRVTCHCHATSLQHATVMSPDDIDDRRGYKG